jgi:hypothetical protein
MIFPAYNSEQNGKYGHFYALMVGAIESGAGVISLRPL